MDLQILGWIQMSTKIPWHFVPLSIYATEKKTHKKVWTEKLLCDAVLLINSETKKKDIRNKSPS